MSSIFKGLRVSRMLGLGLASCRAPKKHVLGVFSPVLASLGLVASRVADHLTLVRMFAGKPPKKGKCVLPKAEEEPPLFYMCNVCTFRSQILDELRSHFQKAHGNGDDGDEPCWVCGNGDVSKHPCCTFGCSCPRLKKPGWRDMRRLCVVTAKHQQEMFAQEQKIKDQEEQQKKSAKKKDQEEQSAKKKK